ncbi:MAG: hypothetical protein JWQ40_630, partial [Segetibacter sp.]|nr:hypothetical protein [Segetibacter sp.]
APKQEPKPEQKPEIKPEIKPETPAPNAGSPSPSAPAARKILIIRNEGFKTKLQGVVDGQNDVQDFNAYLPEGADTKLLVNGSKWMSLKQLCDEIRGRKKITIQEVEILRAEDNQIQRIKVKYKKGLFG